MNLTISNKADFIITLIFSITVTELMYYWLNLSTVSLFQTVPGIVLFVSNVWGFIVLKILAVKIIRALGLQLKEHQ